MMTKLTAGSGPQRSAPRTQEEAHSKTYAFWKTQPVPQIGETVTCVSGRGVGVVSSINFCANQTYCCFSDGLKGAFYLLHIVLSLGIKPTPCC